MVETLKSYFRIDRDLAITAVVVVPAATVWVTNESLTLAIFVGAAMYLAYDYGLPFVRTHTTSENLRWIYGEVRQMIRSIRSRSAKSA